MRHLFLIITIFFTTLGIYALPAPEGGVNAENYFKALWHIYAYDSQGKLLRNGYACCLSPDGQGVTSFATLQGAVRAEIVDYKGKSYAVTRILGANSTTDLVKFQVAGISKAEYFAITEAAASSNNQILLPPVNWGKKKQAVSVQITSSESYPPYQYYHTTVSNETAHFGLPLLGSDGSLVAFVQQNVQKQATTACAIDARFVSSLTIKPTSALNADLRSILIPKSLPDNAKDASAYIFMLPSSDTLSLRIAYDDFVEAYPQMADGYVNRASFAAQRKQFGASEKDLALALQMAAARTDTASMTVDAVRYQISNLIYRAISQQNDTLPPYQDWTLQRAENEAATAYSLNPQTLYLLQQGNCQFLAQKYDAAYHTFLQTCQDARFASASTFFSAARSLELAGSDSLGVMALLDSCIAYIPQPVSAKDAAYYLERAVRLLRMSRYRDAVADYNEYEKAIGPRNLSDRFYALRSQAEMEAHMYQQALDDIRTAIATTATPLPYSLDEAFILLRVGEFQEAIEAASKLLIDLPESPDCYRIIGIAHGEMGHKALAVQNLQKAIELGDDTAASVLPRYQK